MVEQRQSELMVVTKAKDLCTYIMVITEKSPKQFRFTFVSRLQNLSLDIIEDIYRANETYITASDRKERLQKRLDYQHSALTKLKLLSYFASVALEQKCILPKQFEQISKQAFECQKLMGAWINSDKNRFKTA